MSPTYEMLWDCEYCGAKKLLADTHRYCPNCGGKQKAEWRYFPSDADKVEAKDHVYAGADRICPACGVPNSAAAHNCRGCGAALSGAAEVARRRDQTGDAFAGETVADAKRELAEATAGSQQPPPPPPSRSKGWLIGAVVLLALAGVALAFLWKKPVTAVVAGHAWKRSIQIETFGPVPDTAWCDSLPMGAYRVSRSREVRSHRKVPDGEECRRVRHDNGDGTFSEDQRCQPRYRDEPIYDDRCRFLVDRWHPSRTVTATGQSLAEPPAWPSTGLVRAGTCVGCEREGRRSAEYVVHFDVAGKKHDCALDEARWSTFAVGSSWKAKAAVLTGALDCGALQPGR
jgi:ribosomal protein L40E